MIQKLASTLFVFSILFSLSACTPAEPIETPVAKPSVSKATMETKLPEIAVPTSAETGKYIPYSELSFDESSGLKRVLFFHAPWCPYCKAADKAFNDNLARIPDDVILLKTDYDTQKALKAKYAVTYQHTFVYVDADGNPIKIWNGGDINELIDNTK